MIDVTICIFSFNRERFLRNCVESVRTCIPSANIAIFDDDSTDPDTRSYLKEASNYCEIIAPQKVGTIKHGGLYHNMNAALELFEGSQLVCFLQDDTQVVRPVYEAEFREIDQIFEEHSQVGFIHPCFIRGIDLNRHPVTSLPGPGREFYLRQDTGQSAGIHYSDLVIFKPKRLIDAGWEFRQSEPANDKQAKALFGLMVHMWLPFAMWLPEVPAYRGKNKTLGLKLAERKKKVGFYPFRIWPQKDVVEARAQGNYQLPVAETLLQCVADTPQKPWTYNPLTGLNAFKHLNNLEVALRRWFNR
ncbi:glycosyltransferase family 2 protein [Marinobacter halophilus]|uniref:Glycosyltransferase 2-like domain-containing protein n=1 Tax=Marinobacter halophilus TaxID=1323740 RepID=A0A2T1KHP2_9GAMM|nr:glycosyltransferase [Marinobacter halophilus]PSF09102.1 hypothetical protein C7H08_05775 [Marinobacter halophilus]GGC83362.1 hypothetical protein GCM10011362_34740 [Marinobacter halophilus]